MITTGLMVWLAAAAGALAAPLEPATYQRAMQATVYVAANVNYRVSKGGTGFLVDRQKKFVVTNHHVVSGCATVWVYFPKFEDGVAVASRKYYGQHDRPIFGRVVAADARRDLAVVQLDFITPDSVPLALAQEGAWPGEMVGILGNPGNSKFLWEKNSGTVESVGRRHLVYRGGEELNVQIADLKPTGRIGPGYSGGPILNRHGEAVGIISGAAHFGRETFAIDVVEIRELLLLARRHASERSLLLPETAADYQARAHYYQERGCYGAAAVDLTEALRREPTAAELYRERALCYLQSLELGRALGDLAQVKKLRRAHSGG